MNMEALHQPNNIIAQKYQIINTLGEGGSGITYLALHLQNNQTPQEYKWIKAEINTFVDDESIM
ncbi:MAG: hypothetical protein WBF90_17690 [Rivularia sp. (in: cyanobacteria)]